MNRLFWIYCAVMGMLFSGVEAYEEERSGIWNEGDAWDWADGFCEDCFGCDDHSGYFVEADLLIWSCHQGGLDTFITTTVTQAIVTVDELGNRASTGSENEKNQAFSFDWRAGCRLGGGYSFCDGTTLTAMWTHYHGRAHGQGGQANVQASGSWKLDYDVVDLTLGTPMYCTYPSFLWNAFGGVKIARINEVANANNQDFRSTLFVGPIGTVNVFESNTDAIRRQQDMIGAGPELGVNAIWDIGCGVSLYGNAAGAAVFTRVKDQFRDAFFSVASDSDSETTSTDSGSTNNQSNDHPCRFALDLGLGLLWVDQFSYCDHDYGVMFKLGWEQHHWFDHLGTDVDNDNDLCLYGLTLSASLFF